MNSEGVATASNVKWLFLLSLKVRALKLSGSTLGLILNWNVVFVARRHPAGSTKASGGAGDGAGVMPSLANFSFPLGVLGVYTERHKSHH